MSVPSSMVHRSGNGLVVRSLVSGDALFETSSAGAGGGDADADGHDFEDDVKELPDCKVKRNYTCTNCDFFTQNPRVYLYHLRDVHNEKVKVYECPKCLYASKHYQKLLRHKKMVHGSIEEAEVKGKKRQVPDEEEMREVEEVEERQQSLFKCSVCDFSSKSQVSLTKHEKEEHIKTKFFRCSKCTYVTHIKARYTKHVKYHSMPMIKCDMCDFRTPYKWNLDRHCKNHNGHGAFRCSICNFTADIKQSLTVHEMNHHVPPVGQAAGLGVGRRRNKVGASDTTAAEEQAAQQSAAKEQAVQDGNLQQQKQHVNETTQATQQGVLEPPPTQKSEDIKPKQKRSSPSPLKKTKIETETKSFGASDFINPEDIVQHVNGKVYFKNKCKLCNFKTAWDTEMAKHEKKVHNIDRTKDENKPVISKKSSRPIPNLIPIPSQPLLSRPQTRPLYPVLKTVVIPEPSEHIISQKEMSDICAKSSNSVLKDFASLFSSEEMFKCSTPKVPDLIPASMYSSSSSTNKLTDVFKQKNASFFDNLREKLELGTSGSSLTCRHCGHESKCLTEQVKHQKSCGKETNKVQNIIPKFNISSSRCQFCRQRCKSSVDLYNHLQSCQQAIRAQTLSLKEEIDSEPEGELRIDEDHIIEDCANKPHPMENKVFVWNDILVPMDIEVDDSNYEYTEDKIDDNVSLDLSVRTQSPMDSESSYLGQDVVVSNNSRPSPLPTSVDKIPTHGNDISVAQHKRVFKCPHCSFWASTASRFHVHIVGHLNKKPFECSLCAYRSNWRWDITKHIKLKSVRDPAHESAKVLMTDETGRRNYTKYNKYLTEIPVSSEQSMDTSGGCGTRPKHHDRTNSPSTSKSDLPRLNRVPNSSDFSPLLKSSALRPPPALKIADATLLTKITDKKKSNVENKKTVFKCKKCNFKDASRDILLDHVKGHYQPQHQSQQHQHQFNMDQQSASDSTLPEGSSSSGIAAQDFSLRGTSPDRSDERHCRLKHSGDIRVVSTKNGQEKIEVEELTDEPDHFDVPQEGAFKCNHCPYSSDNHSEYEQHLSGHVAGNNSIYKCFYCKFFVSQKEDLMEHIRLHGIADPENLLIKINERNSSEGDGKKFKCIICPYVTNSKSQYTYHKQFHKPRGGQYTCSHCSYNVSKRHLLHQHLKVHGINITSHKQNGDILSIDDITDEIEEVPSIPSVQLDLQNFTNFPDIPLVWVSKNSKFSKMFKCRFCPHVNLRKVNIQEHEKMHNTREKNPNSTRLNDVEHKCTECNYICNNAGVLSSHSKVHQGLYGVIHRLVDPTKTDEEQIRELSIPMGIIPNQENGIIDEIHIKDFPKETEEIDSSSGSGSILYFCKECPARFLKENEFGIHKRFHGSRLFYKCDHCSYTSREKPHVFSHSKVHTSEYQERTKFLQNIYITSINYPQPQIHTVRSITGEITWVVNEEPKSNNSEMSTLCSILNKPVKSSQCVPLSGTDLFLQKSEAEQKHAVEMAKVSTPPPPLTEIDPELIKGDPSFVYPTTLKNGVMKEKRFKCHKCPSAFEKKEQYKVHLGLHGSKQRYKCEHCDYSVKYYANYIQHLKKHKMNAEAKARRSSDEMEEIEEIFDKEEKDKESLTVTDQQQALIQQIRQNEQFKEVLGENKKVFWCSYCPYGSFRKDSIENHQKHHINLSGVKSNFTCDHCDYSVPQNYILKEHVKWHFSWQTRIDKLFQDMVSGYLHSDNVKLISKNVDEASSSDEALENHIIFDESGSKVEEKPSEEIARRFNNNDGESQYVNVQTGEIVVKNETSDTRSDDCDMKDV